MSWAKLDDRANEHRKQEAAGAEACWLWACGLMYCNRQPARDGFIPDSRVEMLYRFKNTKRLAAKLVEVGLWEKSEGGYLVHDFTMWNRSREQLESDRESVRNRVKKHRDKKNSNAVTNKDVTTTTTGVGHGVGTGSGRGSDPDPERATPDGSGYCPVPLPLDDQDLARLELDVGIPRAVADANLRAWAANERAAKSQPRAVSAWVKCGLMALRSRWSDSSKRAEMRALAAPVDDTPARKEPELRCL